MGDPMEFFPAYVMLGAVSCGIGVIVLISLDHSLTNLAQGVFYILVGAALPTAVPLVDEVIRSDPGWAPRLQGLLEAGAIAAACMYVTGLLATSQASAGAARTVRWAVRAGYLLAVVHVVICAAFPAQRLDDYQMGLLDDRAFDRAGFWLFAGFWLVVLMVFGTAYLVLAWQRLDAAEGGRAMFALVGSPLLIATTVVPPAIALPSGALAMLLTLWGQFRYLMAQGRRGAFLSRFLSTQVTDQVRLEGLAEVMKPHDLDLTVVCCDLRGFTGYAEAVPSQAVIDLLAEYYDAVGVAVAEHAGTIKDYAGDGVLILVGAPLPRDDHAAAGLALANRLLTVITPVIDHWSTGPHPLGVGVGVASGRVTVGAIGSSARMEYTAVGTPVNLSARLCAAATNGEILVDHRTVVLARAEDVQPRGSMQVKGLSAAQPVYAVLG